MKAKINPFAGWIVLAMTLAFLAPLNAARAGFTLQVLYEFSGPDGSDPRAALVQGRDGNFYGTTYYGGDYPGPNGRGYGTVFKMTPDGILTTLVSFDGANGWGPLAALVQGSDGDLYGCTDHGGGCGSCFYQCGMVFRITTNGVLTKLVCFDGSNGAFPDGALVQGSDGNFYGTTFSGGANNNGTVFKVTTNGVLTTLFSFNGANPENPGAYSFAGLVLGNDGNFYGTTVHGPGLQGAGPGTVFKMTPGGALTTLFVFGGKNGYLPRGALVQAGDGSFYGTTFYGGAGYNGPGTGRGTVFRITTNGVLTTLVFFNGTNGAFPNAGLIRGVDGQFYGTTCEGGPDYNPPSNYGYGTVFQMTTNGVLTTLVCFNGANGSYPETALVQGSDGNFYGTTRYGGAYDGGTIFRLVQPPPPVITAVSPSNGTVTLTWTSFTNGIYRVEYKRSLAATDWTAHTPDVTATGSTASFTDNVGDATERYYRVVLLP